MIFHGRSKTSIIHIRCKPVADVLNEAFASIVRQCVELAGDRSARHESGDKLLWVGMTDCPVFEANQRVFQPGIISQNMKFFRGVEREGEIKNGFVFFAEIQNNCFEQGKRPVSPALFCPVPMPSL
jgi:hypothetical protein